MRYAAFFRALNVGGRVVKMDALAKIITKAGCSGVETFIASGNAVFESRMKAASLERSLEQALESALGYEVTTFVRTLDELEAIARYRPFRGLDDAPTFVVGFLSAPLSPAAVNVLNGLASPADRFHAKGREFWWHSTIGQGKSEFSNAVFEKALRVRTTFRTVRTVRRMVERWPASG